MKGCPSTIETVPPGSATIGIALSKTSLAAPPAPSRTSRSGRVGAKIGPLCSPEAFEMRSDPEGDEQEEWYVRVVSDTSTL